MLLVGLTGGIGSGKSTVAGVLARRGAVVVDADAASRAVVEPGTPALAAIVERFGTGVLAADGSLDRPALAAVAFATDDERRALEAITHPAIRAEMVRQLSEIPPDAVVVLEVQLLAETWDSRVVDYDAVIVVEAPAELRLDRAVERGMTHEDAARRMRMQATDDERRAYATYVVDNTSDLDKLERQVDEIWADLQRLLRDAPPRE